MLLVNAIKNYSKKTYSRNLYAFFGATNLNIAQRKFQNAWKISFVINITGDSQNQKKQKKRMKKKTHTSELK